MLDSPNRPVLVFMKNQPPLFTLSVTKKNPPLYGWAIIFYLKSGPKQKSHLIFRILYLFIFLRYRHI